MSKHRNSTLATMSLLQNDRFRKIAAASSIAVPRSAPIRAAAPAPRVVDAATATAMTPEGVIRAGQIRRGELAVETPAATGLAAQILAAGAKRRGEST
jgi:hypothetical protein